jgi:putative aldouronate transport system permease protein
MNGFNVMIMRTFFITAIPDALIESARIDGSGEFRTFFQIVLPLALPGVATIGLFILLIYWNDWWLPLMLIRDEKLFNIQFVLYRVINQLNFLASMGSNSNASSDVGNSIGNLPSESARMALAIVAIGPIIFTYPFFQRFFIKGLTIGAIKG